ncbi:hypothetical protein Droror1_Dr00011070 [Drosera rotundifolia]
MSTTPSPAAPPHHRQISLTPGARVSTPTTTPSTSGLGFSSLSDESIWKRLSDAGFSEESIKRRDKAALIAYIASLEAEIYDLQHNMGLLILESKDWVSKCEQAKLSTESVEVTRKRDRAALSSALAEAGKREDNLKKALGIQKQCVESLEKTLHEMRAECAEVKVSAENKMVEARHMIDDAEKKYAEAETKLHAAELAQADATRYQRAAERKLLEVEAREEDLRRRSLLFKSEHDVKEKENALQRQSLSERNKALNELQGRLAIEKDRLEKKEADVLDKLQELSCREKELRAAEESLSTDRRNLMLEKSSLEYDKASISEREKAVIEKEALLDKRDKELLISQEKLATKEHDNAEKLRIEHENALKLRTAELEAQLERRRKLVEEEIDAKRRTWELKELDLKHREEIILEKELELDVQMRTLASKDKDIMERLAVVKERLNIVEKAEKEVELKKLQVEKEKEEAHHSSLTMQKSLHALEARKEEIIIAETDLQIMKSETSELLILETRLKEEIDLVRTQKLELEAEADKLKIEKSQFEMEWELIDEKREELRLEEERIAKEKLANSNYLKEERESLKMERDKIRDQYRQDLQSLCSEYAANLEGLERKHSESLAQIQQERSDMLLEFEVKKRELEDKVSKRHEEIESYLMEKEKAIEEEKKNELQYISCLKENLKKEREQLTLDMKRLEVERVQISLDRERRDKEWAELNNLIEELKVQRQKLKKHRELLHADRGEIYAEIEHLKKLENSKIPSGEIVVHEQPGQDLSNLETQATPCFESQSMTHGLRLGSEGYIAEDGMNNNMHCVQGLQSSSRSTSSISWFKRWVLQRSMDEPSSGNDDRVPDSGSGDEGLRLDGKDYTEKGTLSMEHLHYPDTNKDGGRFSEKADSDEPKIIHEVPSSTGNAKELHDLEKDMIYLSDNSLHASQTPSSRKRSIEISSEPPATSDEDPKQNKKRKQVHDTLPAGLDDVVTSLSQSRGNLESAEFLPDDITAAQELNPDIIEVLAEKAKAHPVSLEDLDLVSKLEVLDDGKSSQAKHGAIRLLIEESTVVEEQYLVNDKEASLPTEGPDGNNSKGEVQNNAKFDERENTKEAKEGVTTRSRSKQQL